MLKTCISQFNYTQLIFILAIGYIGIVYFSIAVSNILLGPLFFVFLLAALKKQVPLNFSKKRKLLYVAVVMPFILTMVSTLMSEHTEAGLKLIVMRLPILVIPFILTFIKFEEKTVKNGLLFFIALTALASLDALTSAIFYANEGILFKTHFAHFITPLHHSYFGVFTFTALLSITELKLIFNKPLRYIIIALFIVAIILTTSRLAYILFLAYTCYFIIKSLPRKLSIVSAIILAILTIGFFSINPNLVSKFHSSIDYQKSPRLQLWNNSLKAIKLDGNYVFGIGLGDYYKIKRENYIRKGRDNGTLGLNPHSQIIEFYIANGIFGLILLSATLGIMISCIRLQSTYAILVFSSILVFSLIECIFNRQIGIQLYAVFVPISLLTVFKDNNI